MPVLRPNHETLKASLQRLAPLKGGTVSQGRHGLVFQRLFWGALAGCLMAFFFGDSPLLENLELSMLDWRYRIAEKLTGPQAGDQNLSKDIAIVAFDDSSQFDLGFPRFNDYHAQETLADILDTVEAGEPDLVAVDLDLRGAANPKLIRVFRQYRNVLLAVFGSIEGSSDLPDAAFLKHAAGYGYDELGREANGMVIRLPVNAPNEVGTDSSGLTQVPSLIEAVMTAYRERKGLSPSDQLQSLHKDQPVYVNYKRTKYPVFSMGALLDPDFDIRQFKDKVVFIAPTLTSRRQDPSHVVTPIRGRTPQVYAHADALSTLIDDKIIFSYPRAIAHHILILLGAFFGAVCSILPMGKRALFMVSGSAFLIVVAQLAFQLWHVALPVVSPLAMLGSGFVLGTVIYLDTDLRLRNRELAAARESMQVRAEEERKRIAEDLHDETLPALSAVARMVDELFVTDNYEESTVPERMRLKLDATIQEMRRVINDLHPSVLETMGFVPALENLAVILERDSGIEYSFLDRNGQDDYELSDFEKLQLYRIVQEGLNNVGKHSKGSKVEVKLQRHGSNLEISITDNGKGINPKTIRRDSHGLLNIRNRAQLINAHVEWRRPKSFESGTEMRISIPLLAIENSRQPLNYNELDTQKGTDAT
jgi:signal transduction histidine kinase